MEDKIIKVMKDLIEIYNLKKELYDKDYWIEKASKEAGFIPMEGDWISIEITTFKIEVSVYHKTNEDSKYWVNGIWTNNSFTSDYPRPDQYLASLKQEL